MQKNPKTFLKDSLLDILIFILGGTLFSVAVNCFTAGNHILNGGFTGIATVLHFLFHVPIGMTVFAFNIPLFLISLKRIGKRFLLRTFAATFILSALVDLGAFLPVYKNDLFLASVIGGALTGTGLGIIFLRNATTGGVDIIAKLVSLKKPHVSMGKSILIFDICVIALGGIVFHNVESMLYAAVAIFVSTQTMDAILYGVKRGTIILVISEKSREIQDLLTKAYGRGVTRLHAEGGYTETPRDVLLCACLDHQASIFTKKIREMDENAFMIVTKAEEILGKGFPKES